MGRIKISHTKEELAAKRREYSKKYYWANKEKVDERVRENYRRKNKSKTQGD